MIHFCHQIWGDILIWVDCNPMSFDENPHMVAAKHPKNKLRQHRVHTIHMFYLSTYHEASRWNIQPLVLKLHPNVHIHQTVSFLQSRKLSQPPRFKLNHNTTLKCRYLCRYIHRENVSSSFRPIIISLYNIMYPCFLQMIIYQPTSWWLPSELLSPWPLVASTLGAPRKTSAALSSLASWERFVGNWPSNIGKPIGKP